MTILWCTMLRSYSDLSRYHSFEDRFDYLKLGGSVGQATFGFDRHINQSFYTSYEWKQVRREVILRDNGCDLGVEGYEIHGDLVVHHINPMDSDNITHRDSWILDPEFLITTTKTTHNAIHYGDRSLLPKKLVVRTSGDTRLW